MKQNTVNRAEVSLPLPPFQISLRMHLGIHGCLCNVLVDNLILRNVVNLGVVRKKIWSISFKQGLFCMSVLNEIPDMWYFRELKEQ